MQKTKINNDYAKALHLIIIDYMAGTNMMKVLKHSPFFWKFQTRVSNISQHHPTFKTGLQKTPIAFKDKLTGKDGYYMQYTFMGAKKYLENLFSKINEKGLYRAHKDAKK